MKIWGISLSNLRH